MKEMNQVEEQLRSWTLRRPSSDLRAKLFGTVAQEPEAVREWRLAWLAPAFACLIAALITLHLVKNPQIFRVEGSSTPLFFAAIGSNAVFSTSMTQNFQFASGTGNMERNVWSTASLHSTNDQWLMPIDSSGPVSRTNHLQ